MLSYLRSGESAPSVLLFVLSTHLFLWIQKIAKPVIYVVENDNNEYQMSSEHLEQISSKRYIADIRSILSNISALKRPLIPPVFFYSGYMQLIPFLLESWWHEAWAPPCLWCEELARLEDGELISLGWANAIPETSETDTTPFLIIHHGASGTTTDFPNQTYVTEAIRRGWTVCVFNRRGHSRKLTMPKFSFFGSTSDVRWVTQRYFRERRPRASIFMLGISAGSGVLARYMGEQGMNSNPMEKIEGFCSAAVGVSPGYNIEKCFARVKYPFADFLLKSVKSFFLKENADLLRECKSFTSCSEATNIQQW